MAERKAISKKLRFEVFKRDKFTCQYCGAMPPDVTLEIDHITPVAKGGTNELLNLVTSCKDCNRGKGKRAISDDSTIKKQQKQLKEIANKREQIEMMMEWQKELVKLDKQCVNEIDKLFISSTNGQCSLTESGEQSIKKWIKQFGFNLVYESTLISLEQYIKETSDGKKYDEESVKKAFNYIPGICRNSKNDEVNMFGREINYLLKILANRFGIDGKLNKQDYWQCKALINEVINEEHDFENIKVMATSCYSISNFKMLVKEYYEVTYGNL